MKKFARFVRVLGLLALISVGTGAAPIRAAETTATLVPPLPVLGNSRMTPVQTPYSDPVGYFYAIAANGDLLWYRRDGATGIWTGPRIVDHGWNQYVDVIPAGGNRFYALLPNGVLRWYRHDGFHNGDPTWTGPIDVGTGWNFPKIFGSSDGVVYAIRADGWMVWYRHNGFMNGGGIGTWTAQIPQKPYFGSNYQNYISMGQGVIYGIYSYGVLDWWHHKAYLTGGTTVNDWNTTLMIGNGWQYFKSVVPIGGGVMFAITTDGLLLRYRNVNYLNIPTPPGPLPPTTNPAIWEGPTQVGNGWASFRKVFAFLPLAYGIVHYLGRSGQVIQKFIGLGRVNRCRGGNDDRSCRAATADKSPARDRARYRRCR
jgi:hypothetical protein